MTAYETLRQVTGQAAVVLADNPGVMTLDGTNTWILRGEPSLRRAIVVDPGPLDEHHLDVVEDSAGSVELILLTHAHLDHSEAARRLHERTAAPVLALDPQLRLGGEGVGEGTVLSAAGVELRVWHTPGHTADSLSFVLTGEDGGVAVLTGDTILGRGTTVVAHPDGVLADYLASLHRLSELHGITVLPGHGPELADAGVAASAYLAHRERRLDQVRSALAVGGAGLTPRQVVERVYADVDEALWPAAELSVRAQLAYLRELNA
ncbi:MBL fold metallo-hydrolase [Jatrophihabitans telluris]|uniref:MBL fold metallo-hydrolase n=1 Tax=Jatrophihabitans telluris TaxID=2038343 RepID=A0ABY4QXF2_9ACTN|nr:MBL fold metallo-hydrolase [Jatrophihabitans telluris]UQX88163.1 MBL fold metallo-hydrolase [Jatrophihabitans telluris]